jgi:DNA-binding HxlR family transcriptional regulator
MNNDTDQPLAVAQSTLAPKWSVHIIHAINDQDHSPGFNTIQSALEPISSKVLSENLERLVSAGVIRRERVSKTPVRVKYSLSSAGQDLLSIIDDLQRWGENHIQNQNASYAVLAIGLDSSIMTQLSASLNQRYTVERCSISRAVSVMQESNTNSHSGVNHNQQETAQTRILLIDHDAVASELHTVSIPDHHSVPTAVIVDELSEKVSELTFHAEITKPFTITQLCDTVGGLAQMINCSPEAQRLIAFCVKQQAMYHSLISRAISSDMEYHELEADLRSLCQKTESDLF